jgi:hypothetical protein
MHLLLDFLLGGGLEEVIHLEIAVCEEGSRCVREVMAGDVWEGMCRTEHTHVRFALSPICMAHWAVTQQGQQQDRAMSMNRLLLMPECLATAWRWMIWEQSGRQRDMQQPHRKLWPIATSVMPYWMQGQK